MRSGAGRSESQSLLSPSSPPSSQTILDSADGDKAWALVHFDELSPRNVEYSIRLNYSTVPNTNLITNFINRGLDTTYQRCSSSNQTRTSIDTASTSGSSKGAFD